MAEPFPPVEGVRVDGEIANPHIWVFLGQIEREMPGEWVLVGGQMVLLLGLEAGQVPKRETTDADALVDVRLVPKGTRKLAETLLALGLKHDGVGPEGIGHRFKGKGLSVDVLAPKHLGPRADLTVGPAARTIGIPAGQRMLRAPRRCAVVVDGQLHHVPRPDLDAAIVGKAAGFVSLPDPSRHGEDLAFLLGLVADLRSLDARLDTSDRKYLRRAAEKLAQNERVWQYTSRPEDARAALRFVAGAPP